MLRAPPQLRIRRLKSRHLFPQIWRNGTFHRRTVIDERADRDTLDELLEAADVIDMIVRRDQVVDPRDAGSGDRLHQPADVAGAGASAVDQDGLA